MCCKDDLSNLATPAGNLIAPPMYFRLRPSIHSRSCLISQDSGNFSEISVENKFVPCCSVSFDQPFLSVKESTDSPNMGNVVSKVKKLGSKARSAKGGEDDGSPHPLPHCPQIEQGGSPVGTSQLLDTTRNSRVGVGGEPSQEVGPATTLASYLKEEKGRHTPNTDVSNAKTQNSEFVAVTSKKSKSDKTKSKQSQRYSQSNSIPSHC